MNRHKFLSLYRPTAYVAALILALTATTAALVADSTKQAAQENIQTIDVAAKNYDFTPSEIHVKAGTTVKLRVLATDRDHGVQFDLYPDGAKKTGEPGLRFTSSEAKTKTPKGQPTEIQFAAFRCSVVCGMGHHRMKGKLVVEP
jgi:cytochrome c oxidase subunit II